MTTMVTLFRDGGWSMFVVVLFGFISLATAGFYAARPDAKHEGFIQWMSRATFWAILVGICSDFATVCQNVGQIEDWNQRGRIVLEGTAESLSPGIMGFAFLALTALLAAVGRRRLDARKA
jgi:predicted benzoate:H+ symporter BenE